MAQETKTITTPQSTSAPAPEAKSADTVIAPAPEAKSDATSVTAPAPPKAESAAATSEVAAAAEETPAVADDGKKKKKIMGIFSSFKEESNVVGDLNDAHKKALDELKDVVKDALKKHEFYAPKGDESKKDGAEKPADGVEEVKKEPEKPEAEEVKKEEGKPAAEAEELKKDDQHTPAVPVAAPAPEAKTVDVKVEEESKEVKEEVKKDEHATAAAPAAAAPASGAEKGKTKVTEEPKNAEEAKTAPEAVKTDVQPQDAHASDAAKTVQAIHESVVEAPAPAQEQVNEPELPPEEVSIWGIPLLADERSDTILLKFLRARDYKVKDAFTMLKNTVRWRKEFGVDDLLEEDLGNDWEKVIYVHGTDKEGHPVCYNVYGEFMDKDLYQKTFSDEEKRNKFIKWVIQSLEKSVRKLDFSPSGISSIVQVNDMNNSPGLLKRELRQTTDKALQLLQDNYPEFVAKQVFVNVPWWYLAFYTVISPFFTQRSKSKFVISSPARAADTLFKYIAPEQVPLQYGGLTCQGKQDFSTADAVSEVTIKASSEQTVEFPVSEKSHFLWQLRVIGWDVSYGAEFVPDAEDGYTVIVQKSRKIAAPDEPVIFNGYKVGEPGKIVVTIGNTSSKRKKLLYRSKSIPISG